MSRFVDVNDLVATNGTGTLEVATATNYLRSSRSPRMPLEDEVDRPQEDGNEDEEERDVGEESFSTAKRKKTKSSSLSNSKTKKKKKSRRTKSEAGGGEGGDSYSPSTDSPTLRESTDRARADEGVKEQEQEEEEKTKDQGYTYNDNENDGETDEVTMDSPSSGLKGSSSKLKSSKRSKKKMTSGSSETTPNTRKRHSRRKGEEGTESRGKNRKGNEKEEEGSEQERPQGLEAAGEEKEEEAEEEEEEEEEREPTPEEKRAKAMKNRTNVVREILDTEKSYVDGLRQLVEMYVGPLRKAMEDKGWGGMGNYLTDEDLKRIFSTVELIYNLNNTLLGDIQKRLDSWNDEACIGNLFLHFAPMFKLYSDYVKNYADAMVHLSQLTERYSKFAEFLKQAAAANRQVLGIHTFLIMPVQRLPRYILLLNEVKKNTPEDHPDRNAILKSVVIFQQVTDQVNQSIKVAENIAKITSIQSSLLGKINLVDPARKFVKEGLLTKITSRFIKECMFYLFNDILIYTYPMPLGYYQWKGTIQLGPSWIRDLHDTPQVKNSFQIVSRQKTYTVFAATPEIKKEWMDAIQQQVDFLVQLQPELAAQRSEVKVRQRGGLWKLLQKGLSYSLEEFDSEAQQNRLLTKDKSGVAFVSVGAAPPPPPSSSSGTLGTVTAGTPLLHANEDGSGRVGLFRFDDGGASIYDGGWCKGGCCTIL